MATDAENFLDDIKAAVTMGQPLESESAGSSVVNKHLTLQQIDKMLVSPDQQNHWSPRLKAAFAFAQQTGAMGTVFDGLSVRLETQHWRDKVLRRTGWYLLLLVVTMVAGLIVFFYWSNPLFESLRSDLQLMSVSQHVPPADPAAWMLPTIIGGVVLALLAAVWIILRGPQRAVWLCGGRSISQWRQTSVALRAIEQSHQAGMPMDESIQMSCDLVAASDGTRAKIRSALSGARESLGIVAWADAMAAAARDRMTKIELWLPLATTTIIGSALATIYCLLIYRPIISMLRELASAAEGL